MPLSIKTGRRAKYPFSDMQVGDAFDVEIEEDINQTKRAVYGAAYGYRKKNNPSFAFVVGASPDAENYIRLIRTA